MHARQYMYWVYRVLAYQSILLVFVEVGFVIVVEQHTTVEYEVSLAKPVYGPSFVDIFADMALGQR